MRILKLLVLSIVGFVLSVSSAFAFPQWGLAGPWYHDGQPVSIQERFHQNYVFCNEQGDCANGFMNYPGNIVVPQWQVTGNIQGNGNTIFWSNNTVWVRNNFPPYGPTPPVFNPTMLNGQWFHDGQVVFVNVYGNGQVSITNEERKVFSGYISSPRTIFIPSLGLRGDINHRADKIRWSNNTVWRR